MLGKVDAFWMHHLFQKFKTPQKISVVFYPVSLVCLVLWLFSMVNFFETRSYWQGGFTEDQQEYYKEYRLSQKGINLWKLINQLNNYAGDLCLKYEISYCFDESCCCCNFKHLHFQCACNVNETLASYAKGNYDFYDVEQIEEFIAWKGAFEISSLLENEDDAPYKSESFAILKYCMDNYKDDNAFITEYLKGLSPQKKRLMPCRSL